MLATRQTLASSKVSKLLVAYGADAQILLQPCPGWVEQVEKGDLSSPATKLLVEKYVVPLLSKGADTLVLGCTHYPFLTPVIRAIAGPAVTILDPAAAVARSFIAGCGQAVGCLNGVSPEPSISGRVDRCRCHRLIRCGKTL